MSRFVMDCSVTMAWCFEDESDAYSVSLLKQAEASEVIVPWIWPLEVANVLLTGERRDRLTEAASARFLGILRGFPIMVDAVPPAKIMDDLLALGRRCSLSSYDASYLELAMREGLPLATTDDRLRAAAAELGVKIVAR